MILLGVNIDHCATVREARYREYGRTHGEIVEPDPLAFAFLAERAGADGITVHPREDQRHVKRSDVLRLKEHIQVPLNMEMAATDEMVKFALQVKPTYACVVPESREEVTTEGGLDVAGQPERIKRVTQALQEAGIKVSLFIDPDPAQIMASAQAGATFVELHTGAYANAYYDEAKRAEECNRLKKGAVQAHELGLTVNLGHGINYVNVAEMRLVPHVHEMNIGHSIISRALMTGCEEAVREMKRRMNPGLF
ncbi:MAG: pyridoxine 5'-phosphate synthase [Verrucomicrobiota bacterium JB022]|nr:pyridoxine 5'-phosphate synthase [Verrucomicrobiota bacterium JB022]